MFHQVEHEESIRESADFVVVGSPYNMQCIRDNAKFQHCQLHGPNESNNAPVWSSFEIQLNGHLFCTALQIRQWYWAQSRKSEDEEIVHDSGKRVLKKSETRVSPLSEMSSILLQCFLAVGTYQKNCSVWRAQNTKVQASWALVDDWWVVERKVGSVGIPGAWRYLDEDLWWKKWWNRWAMWWDTGVMSS